MKRFNLGFLKFGPLEQCANGNLMYYADHISTIGDYMKKISSKEEQIQQLNLDLDHCHQKNEYLIETKFVIKFCLGVSTLLNSILLFYIYSILA